MIALLAIEVDDSKDIDNLNISYRLFENDEDSCFQMEDHRGVASLPRYKGETKRSKSTVVTWYDVGFKEGFNACIDVIRSKV